jgi:hypothetical protein
MRLSLKDLLAIVAFAALMSWCAAELGYDAAFWIFLVTSSIASWVFVSAARHETGRILAIIAAALPLCLICLLVISPATVINAALLLAGAIAVAVMPRQSVRMLTAAVMLITATTFTLAAMEARRQAARLEEMRREFPVVSLAHRLDYEKEAPRPEATPAKLGSVPAKSLDEFEAVLDQRWRAQDLRMIHSRQYEQFVRSMGFGVMRMRRPSSQRVRRPPLRDIAFNERWPEDYDRQGNWEFDFGEGNSAVGLHKLSRGDFLDADGFGHIIERQQSAGFIEHGMHFSPVNGLKDEDAWTIEQLELVSLLKFDAPRVYVLEHLPRMDQLSSDDAPTRELDDFEAKALKLLWTEEDIVLEQHDDVYRMVGSLRAAKQCLDCHSVERGELLGAFTYVLRRGESGALGFVQAGDEMWPPGAAADEQ